MIKILTCAFVFAGLASQVTAGPLHNAARDGDVEAVKALIADGEDVNRRNRMLGWPLHQAAAGGNVELVELLLASGAEVDVDHRIFGTPLRAAVANGHGTVVLQLIAAGADVNAKWVADETTSLHLAAERGNAPMVELLVANGADLNALSSARRDADDAAPYTAMHSAAKGGHFHIVDLLRALGASGPVVEPVSSLLPTAEVLEFPIIGRGSQMNCWVCHSLEQTDTTPKAGPPLGGVVGRKKASVEGFPYSEAFRRLGGVWSVPEINALIASPMHYAPGTKMSSQSVVDPRERAALIALLLRHSSGAEAARQ